MNTNAIVKAGGVEYGVFMSSACDDPTCSCGPTTFKSQTDLLMFLRDRLNMGGVGDLVAAALARDIDATLKATTAR